MLTHAPARTPRATTPAPGLDARLAAVDAGMTLRLERAALAVSCGAAHLAAPVLDLADVVTLPVELPAVLPSPDYRTPAAALLQRAARRLEAGGWCQGATVAEDGARCLYGAVHAEAATDPTGRAEDDALAVLLEAIRRRWPGVETIPEANDHRLPSGRAAVELLDDAAALADARGL
ncbi:hypothetical protein F0L17_26690 [Streptomyces sp. TRM43335]|uniref:Uncharacterized protein n=1 Tax=Streptomyces taklimakanensis TaxID=2569853 RepID=A0A6G2BK21_9ACTN|nr:hypothetical protein [Streptomyces taklimakanensis]MTE22618.1 hypothetical protein [Streptomyces taklimakanensis]